MGKTVARSVGDDGYGLSRLGETGEVVLTILEGVEARVTNWLEPDPSYGERLVPGDTVIYRPAREAEKFLHAITADVEFEIDNRTTVPPGVPGSDPNVDYVEFAARHERSLVNHPNLAFVEDTVAASGTAEALNGGTTQPVPNGMALLIRALSGNTNPVYVGDSTVTTSDGYPLSAGETVRLKIQDVSSVFIDVDTNGEGVRWIMEAT